MVGLRTVGGAAVHLRVCHDICHSAVMFEDQSDVLARLRRSWNRRWQGAGVVRRVLSISMRFGTAERQQAKQALASFAEDRYLHQTSVRAGCDGAMQFFEDLPQALTRSTFERPVASSFSRPHLLRAIRPAADDAGRH